MAVVLLWVGAVAAAGIHVLIFALESLWFRRPEVQRRFGVRGELPETTRLFAFNQGFYNLLLGIGTFAGLAFLAAGHEAVGLVLVAWNVGCMLVAAVVLLASSLRLWRGAVVQGGPALVTLLALFLGLR